MNAWPYISHSVVPVLKLKSCSSREAYCWCFSPNSDLFILVRNKHAQSFFPSFYVALVYVGGGGYSPEVFTSSVSAYWIFKFQSDAHNNTHLTSCDWHFGKVFVFIKTNTYAMTQTDKNKTASGSNADRLTWQVKLKQGHVMLCKQNKKMYDIHEEAHSSVIRSQWPL